jgi:RND family efflux transporter MFP subunit
MKIFKIIKDKNLINTKKKKIISLIVFVVILTSIIFIVVNKRNSSEILNEDKISNLPLVEITTAQKFAGEGSINLIGLVRAFSETALTAEASGRVTSVPVSLGDTVFAGQIIATIENASEQAAVQQAEGSYEAALVSANQNINENSESSFDNKRSEIISILNRTFISADNIIKTKVDLFIENPNNRIPNFSVSLRDYFLRQEINDQRYVVGNILDDWNVLVDSLNIDSVSIEVVDKSISYIKEIEYLLELISSGSIDFQATGSISSAEISSYISSVSSSRDTVASLIVDLNRSKESLRDNSSQVLIEDAQLKQSLGALNAARANLAKTIITSPISGTVNNLSVRTGDFVSVQQKVAEIANNNALEIVTFVGSSDRKIISVGDEVIIEEKYKGTITEIAPAIDSATGKTEVRIASESSEFQNGDTVRISKTFENSEVDMNVVNIPLSAIRFQLEDGFVFTIENDELVLKPVELGTIRGGSAEILSGLSSQDEFVIDARGLVEATKVEVKR